MGWGVFFMEKFAFVILHYNTVDDTFNCVNSIKECCCNTDYRIYIVDNASPNDSGKMIKEKYGLDGLVKVILSNNNLGFARGNNIGIDAARNDGYSDFIIVTNSDTKIIQKDFCELIKKIFYRSSFSVLGPTIFTPKGETFANPFNSSITSLRELKKVQNYYKKGVYLLQTNKDYVWNMYAKMHHLKLRIIGKFKRIIANKPSVHRYTENCILHGCCLIFSKLFFEKFNGFDPRTFLYVEEQILHAHVVHSGLKTVYDPELKIWHKEDGATDSIYKEKKEKLLFLYTNILKSLEIYKDVLESYKVC